MTFTDTFVLVPLVLAGFALILAMRTICHLRAGLAHERGRYRKITAHLRAASGATVGEGRIAIDCSVPEKVVVPDLKHGAIARCYGELAEIGDSTPAFDRRVFRVHCVEYREIRRD